MTLITRLTRLELANKKAAPRGITPDQDAETRAGIMANLTDLLDGQPTRQPDPEKAGALSDPNYQSIKSRLDRLAENEATK